MPYLERNFQTDFNKWAKHLFKRTAVFELKISKTDVISFTDVKEHQVNALLAAKHANFVFKIPDGGWQNPFDCFSMCKVPAYVVIMFRAQTKNQKEFFLIDIDDWVKEKATSARKSLTEARARQIAQTFEL